MKYYVLGSSHFMKEMVDCKNRLCAMGLDAWIHPDYEAFVRGEKQEIMRRWHNGEHAEVKRENNYLKAHYDHILKSDALLFVNAEKNGKKDYVGGNVLIEMGQGYVNNKKMFLLYGLPEYSSYIDEIKAMDPICLEGKLEDIVRH